MANGNDSRRASVQRAKVIRNTRQKVGLCGDVLYVLLVLACLGFVALGTVQLMNNGISLKIEESPTQVLPE
jgi:hypothetical protein